MRQTFASLLVALGATLAAGAGAAQESGRAAFTEGGMKIRIIVDGAALDATLEDTAASRDFAAMLPMEVTLEDYHGTEKIHTLPSRLSTDGAPDGVDPEIGDITYFAPWGNLALFYRDFGYSRGLVRLGRIEDGVERLAVGGDLDVRIERIEEPE